VPSYHSLWLLNRYSALTQWRLPLAPSWVSTKSLPGLMGGNGEVYCARGAKLGRDVALKRLPEGFARDADRMARFQREARVLASLNHPNIASIYGLDG
jgi:serine/threonine protein kinase